MRRNWPMRIAVILLFLVLFTTYLMFGLFARYVTKSNSSDSARVIKFYDIHLVEQKNQLIITPGVDCVRDVAVDFDGSEAATYVFVEVEPSNHWSSGDGNTFYCGTYMSFSINSTNWKYLEKDGNNYVYYYVGTNTVDGLLKPNCDVNNVDILANNGAIKVYQSLTMDDFDKLDGLELEFTATAVQGNGFESVNDAWTSIKAKH